MIRNITQLDSVIQKMHISNTLIAYFVLTFLQSWFFNYETVLWGGGVEFEEMVHV